MITQDPARYSMELGPMGPIGEGGSLLLRVNRNCPWNSCLFCPVYKGRRFSVRSASEIMADIDAVSRTWDCLDAASWSLGLSGRMNGVVVREARRAHPAIYGPDTGEITPDQLRARQTLAHVANWLAHGAARVFLLDADSLAMKPGELTSVLGYLKKRFPTVETVAAYARSKTCSRRSAGELKDLRESGLAQCLVGIESGNDALLAYMRKGVTPAEHRQAGARLADAGIAMAAFVMPGLGGKNGELKGHMRDTLEVLNDIRPREVRVRSLAVIQGSPLDKLMQSGLFAPPDEEQMIEEMAQLIEGIAFECVFETLQMTNPLLSVRVSLSRHRADMMERIGRFRGMPSHKQAEALLERVVHGGYLDLVMSWGRYDEEMDHALSQARESIMRASEDALATTNAALRLIKAKGIP
jgi:hypothetical protein